jgi:type II secretory pathway predicted ATPase ExeA
VKALLHRRFGLPADPWAGCHLPTTDATRVAQAVEAAAEAQLLVSILGARGAGKTHAVRQALRGLRDIQTVEPLRLGRERLHIGDVESAIIRELAPHERPRRSGEARSHQVRRVLGQGARTHPVILLVDDAHVLHRATLRALKRLRELSWLGVARLLGIVLLGQADRAASIPELGLRSDRLWLAGLLPEEAETALEQALNRRGRAIVIEPEATAALGASAQARNWLDLAALADDCLLEAAARGEDRITAAVADAVLHPQRPAEESLDERVLPDDGAVAALLGRLDGAGRRETRVA